MIITVIGWQKWDEVVAWLSWNIGPLLWAKPIIEWRGKGWHMHRTPHGYDITVHDEQLAVLTLLRWA
jgi:hypothetical protein